MLAKLPKNFPEYSLMYKILDKKISELKTALSQSTGNTQKEKLQNQLSEYQKELKKIKSLFPENFFESK